MLLEFTVGNFRSFREQQTLSMVAAKLKSKYDDVDKQNVIEFDPKLSLLRTSVIYGANASGKSNLAKAISFFKRFVFSSSRDSQSEDPIPVEPFRLDTKYIDQPSFFEVVFILDNKKYRYGFETTRSAINSEWLYFVPTTQEATLFERSNSEFYISRRFKEGKGLESKTRDNALFLSVVAQFNGEIAKSILGWFRSFNYISGIDDAAIQNYTVECLKNDRNRDEIVEFVKSLDLGLDDIYVEDAEFSLPAGLPERLKEVLLETSPKSRTIVKTKHRIKSKSKKPTFAEFNLDSGESEGTKKLFAMAGPVIDTLKNGKVLVIDEMDARLHPSITSHIVDMFRSPLWNSKGAQLVFFTHDTNQLSHRRFRRDQIWFVEKDRDGASHLYSLAEFRVRNDASFEQDYIQGKYGAIPFLGSVNRTL